MRTSQVPTVLHRRLRKYYVYYLDAGVNFGAQQEVRAYSLAELGVLVSAGLVRCSRSSRLHCARRCCFTLTRTWWHKSPSSVVITQGSSFLSAPCWCLALLWHKSTSSASRMRFAHATTFVQLDYPLASPHHECAHFRQTRCSSCSEVECRYAASSWR